jgi:hypothetical protein
VRQWPRVRQQRLPFFLPHSRRPVASLVSLHLCSERSGRAHDSHHHQHDPLPSLSGLSPCHLLGRGPSYRHTSPQPSSLEGGEPPYTSLRLVRHSPFLRPSARVRLCLDLTSHRIIISRHVVFDENVFPLAGSTPPTDLDSLLESDPVPPHPRRLVLRRYLLLARPRRPRLRHARPRRSRLRHARPHRPRLRHARPRRPRLRHARPRRPRLASPTPRSSTTAAATPLPRRPPTRAHRRARPASPTQPSSITAASRPPPLLSTFRRSASTRPSTTWSPSTATPDTSTRW